MELKRVLESDNRRATAKAVELYGKEALIISNQRINGKIELIVAVDLDPANGLSMDALDPPAPPGGLAPILTATAPGERFAHVLQGRMGELRHKPDSSVALRGAEEFDTHRQELEKAKDIVEMLRREFVEIRRELGIAQRLGALQAPTDMTEAVRPLALALVEAGVPVGLRSLLIDEIRTADSLPNALTMIGSLLTRSIRREKGATPLEGVNVIAGPSGAGKTMMLGRLAATHTRVGTFLPEQVAIVSFNDRRPGAWNQIQLLSAQAGIDCYRAADKAILGEILHELASRKLVLVDTAGVAASDHLDAISATMREARFHLLLPADASAATIKRWLDRAPRWESLMLTKLDEAMQPWPMIQWLSEVKLPISFASKHATDALIADPVTEMLVKSALAHLVLPATPMPSLRERPVVFHEDAASAKKN